MLGEENAHKKSHFFQALIEENSDFIENPQKYPQDVFPLFVLFFGREKMFNNYAFLSGVEKGINYIMLMTLDEKPINIYQINEVIYSNGIGYRTIVSDPRGIRYLKRTVEKMLNQHISRSIEEILRDLKKEKMEKLEQYLRFRSNIPNYSIQKRMSMTGVIFYTFFEGRDTKISFEEYCIEAEYRKEYFTCSFLREDSCELKFEFNQDTGIMRLDTLKGSRYGGALKLQEKIADYVFSV